jgi:hypothetical protein
MTECRILIPDLNNIMDSLRTTTSKSIQNMSQTGARKTMFFPPPIRKDSMTETSVSQTSSMAPSDQVPLCIMISMLLLAPYIGPMVDNFYKSIGKGWKHLQSNINITNLLETHKKLLHFMKEAWKELELILNLWSVTTVDFVQFCIHYWINLLATFKHGVCSINRYGLRQIQCMVSCTQGIVQSTAEVCQSILVGGCKSLSVAYSNCKNTVVKNMKACSSITSVAIKNLHKQVLTNGVYMIVMAAKATNMSVSVLSTFIGTSWESSLKALKRTVDMVADGSSFAYSKVSMTVALCTSITVKSAIWSTKAAGKIINNVIVFVLLAAKRLIDMIHSVVENSPQWLEDFVEFVPFLEFEEDERVVLTKTTQRILYLMSILAAANPSLMLVPQKDLVKSSNIGKSVVDNAVKKVQFRLFPPRALFMYGSLLRGLQTTSKLETVFQPSIGVGAVVNIGSILANETWMVPIVAGWFISGEVWRIVGATVPNDSQ